MTDYDYDAFDYGRIIVVPEFVTDLVDATIAGYVDQRASSGSERANLLARIDRDGLVSLAVKLWLSGLVRPAYVTVILSESEGTLAKIDDASYVSPLSFATIKLLSQTTIYEDGIADHVAFEIEEGFPRYVTKDS